MRSLFLPPPPPEISRRAERPNPSSPDGSVGPEAVDPPFPASGPPQTSATLGEWDWTYVAFLAGALIAMAVLL